MSVSSNLNRILAERKINQKELSELSGLPASTISNALSDESDPRSSTLSKIAIALGISVDLIIFNDQERESIYKPKVVNEFLELKNLLNDNTKEVCITIKYNGN